jgi:hypothetical protein
MSSLFAVLFLTCLAQTAPSIKQHGIHERGANYSIDIKYPAIQSGDTFNAGVRHAVRSLAEKFKKDMPGVDTKNVSVDSYLKGNYKAATLKNGTVSVLLDYDEYTSGAAHPWGLNATINYDGRTCRVLTLADLFRPGVNYISRVSQLAIAAREQNEFADRNAIPARGWPWLKATSSSLL